jgi:predicted transcriptional regulator of viral defense system
MTAVYAASSTFDEQKVDKMGLETPTERVVQLVSKLGVARIRDFKAAGIHHRYVFDAYKNGLIEKTGSGIYSLPGKAQTPGDRLVEACKRVPQGVICLFSALWFHGLIAEEPDAVWMTIDTKARAPQIDSRPIKFVFASGDALAQGVVTLGLIDEVQIRVYSPMKTVADCFKYADKIGTEVGLAALAAAVASNKYNRQRLLRFAEICRVKQAVATAENARMHPKPAKLTEEAKEAPGPARVWDREVLEKEVWSEPIRQLAKKYGVSDVAIHKHCKKMGSSFPAVATGLRRPAKRSRRPVQYDPAMALLTKAGTRSKDFDSHVRHLLSR